MDIVSMLVGFVGGGVIGGGVLFGLQKGKLSELSEIKQRYEQVRQVLDNAEAELEEKKGQLQLLDLSEVRMREIEAKYKGQIEELEQSSQVQQQQLEQELERTQTNLQIIESTYQAQILSMQETASSIPSTEAIERSYQARIQDYEAQLTELQQSHLAELEQFQQSHQTQLQGFEQTYQAQIDQLEQTYQTQILELQQAVLAVQQAEQASEESQPEPFVEPWDEMESVDDQPEAEKISEIYSLEELVVPPEEFNESEENILIDTPIANWMEFPSEVEETIAPVAETDWMESPSEVEETIAPVAETDWMEFPSEVEEASMFSELDAFAPEIDSPELDFLESLQPEMEEDSYSVNLEEQEMPSEAFVLVQSEELISATQDFSVTDSSSSDLDFLETLQSEEESLSLYNLEELTTASEEFFAAESSTAEDSFLDLMPTDDEIALETTKEEDLFISAEDLFSSETMSPELDLFDPFDAQGYDPNKETIVNGHSYTTNGFDSSDDDLAFLNMLDENSNGTDHIPISEDLDDLPFDELFDEELLNSDWKSSQKSSVDSLESYQ